MCSFSFAFYVYKCYTLASLQLTEAEGWINSVYAAGQDTHKKLTQGQWLFSQNNSYSYKFSLFSPSHVKAESWSLEEYNSNLCCSSTKVNKIPFCLFCWTATKVLLFWPFFGCSYPRLYLFSWETRRTFSMKAHYCHTQKINWICTWDRLNMNLTYTS